ncbi:uncharacterized protein LOC116015629 isoform X1 [Ipomoea triloba]|uniref:uncharacterized protein LOC116015629 isoform X1 n=2 Tax=Ipomoea triloba TaxID=35885 RepID=UPI00125E0A33|nr:uncharacterized protein LOC116015629 isoform X1 [Ipomoea triloba]XP_031111625.1 uncharacterized protein LOC116015629 isoform X1 [Ipomoea triloba]XP_031111633.1 uncharacterized protein LOC116015629 isoform X1 [Ipomoea triloba]
MPDSTEYSAMDLKNISWFGNMYQKFEALCLEVEEDTVNYVESQVQIVGESVKKFYSEVMQDLRPRSYVDPVKVARNDLSLFAQNEIEKKAKENLVEQPGGVDMKLSEDSEVLKGKNNLGGKSLGIGENSKDDQSLLKMSGSVTPLSEERNRMPSVYENRRGYSMARDHITVALPEFGNSECTSSLARGCASKETTTGSCDHIPVVSMPVISSSIGAAASDTTSPVESSGLLVEDFALISSFGGPSLRSSERPQNCNTDVVETFDVTEQVMEMVELIDEQQLEETCVLIEGNKLHFPEQPVKHKSYKKKIREAFCSKKGSTREYEHLVAQHEGQPLNREAEENVMPALVAKLNMKLSASGFPDSEWEII